MAVKIRLARRGRRKQPFYHIIVADARSPRDGKFIERIGSYNPMTKPATIDLDREKAYEWLLKGAQPTETARSILRFKGVLYKKHLQRGVAKGAMSQEAADALYEEYITAKEAKIAARFEQSLKEKLDFHARVSGSPKKVYVEEAAATEALSQFQEAADGDAAAPATAEAAGEVVAAAAEAKEEVAEAATEVKEEVAEAATEAKEEVVEAATEAKEEVVEAATEAKEEVVEAATEAKEEVAPVAASTASEEEE